MSNSQKRRKLLYAQQDERCHEEWGCGQEADLRNLDEAHLTNLGMGASRQNADDPRNAEGKTVLLCRKCHQAQERLIREAHRLWKAGLIEWIDPFHDNYNEVAAEVTRGLKQE